MKKFTKYALTLSTMTIMAVTGFGEAMAEYKPNRKDTGPTREQIEELGFTGILPLNETGFTLFQRPNTPTNELVFKVISRIPLEGCFKTMPYELEQKYEGKTIIMDLKFPIVEVDRRRDCEKKRSMESVETIIDLDELREKDINVMRLTSRYQTRSFDLDLTDERIKLEPRDTKMSQGLEYWLLPSNVVMLSVPMAKDDIYYKSAMLQELANVAESRDLIPIEDKVPDFIPKTNKYNKFYFLDTEGTVRDMLNDGQGSVAIGSIHKTEVFYGPHGKYDKKMPIEVIATLPNEMD